MWIVRRIVTFSIALWAGCGGGNVAANTLTVSGEPSAAPSSSATDCEAWFERLHSLRGRLAATKRRASSFVASVSVESLRARAVGLRRSAAECAASCSGAACRNKCDQLSRDAQELEIQVVLFERRLAEFDGTVKALETEFDAAKSSVCTAFADASISDEDVCDPLRSGQVREKGWAHGLLCGDAARRAGLVNSDLADFCQKKGGLYDARDRTCTFEESLEKTQRSYKNVYCRSERSPDLRKATLEIVEKKRPRGEAIFLWTWILEGFERSVDGDRSLGVVLLGKIADQPRSHQGLIRGQLDVAFRHSWGTIFANTVDPVDWNTCARW